MRSGGIIDRAFGAQAPRRVHLTPAGDPVGDDVEQRWPTWEVTTEARAHAAYAHGSGDSNRPIVLEHVVVQVGGSKWPAVVSFYREEWRRPRARWASRVLFRAEVTPKVAFPLGGDSEATSIRVRARDSSEATAAVAALLIPSGEW